MSELSDADAFVRQFIVLVAAAVTVHVTSTRAAVRSVLLACGAVPQKHHYKLIARERNINFIYRVRGGPW